MENNKKTFTKGRITLTQNDNRISMIGYIDSQNPREDMEPFFLEAHNTFIKNKIKEVFVDLTGLEFINSKGIGEIVAWVNLLDQTSAEKRYFITFLLNRESDWQKICFSSIILTNPDFLKMNFMGNNEKTLTKDRITLTLKDNWISMIGYIDAHNPREDMEPFFLEAHNIFIKNKYKDVMVDVRKLEFINSEGIGEILAWINLQEHISAAERYIITFILNPDSIWQEMCFSAILLTEPDFLKMNI